MSHSNTSIDNNTCGGLEQPCYTFLYAQQIAEHGDTIALDRNHKFYVNYSINTVVGRDLDLTSYCVEDSCASRKTATVTIDYIFIFFLISSSNNVKLSRLRLIAGYGEPATLLLSKGGKASVKMKDCVVTSNVFYLRLFKEIDSSHFKTIEINNVVFVGKQPFQPPSSHQKSNSPFSYSNYVKSKDHGSADVSSTLQSKDNYRTKQDNLSSIISISKSYFQDIGLRLTTDYQSSLFNMNQNTFNASLLSVTGSTKCVLNIISHRHYGSPIFVQSNYLAMNLTMIIKDLTSTYSRYSFLEISIDEI